MTDHPETEEYVPETADGIELMAPTREDALNPEWSELPPVPPPFKLPVPGVPTGSEAKLIGSEHTRFRGRSKYRAWA